MLTLPAMSAAPLPPRPSATAGAGGSPGAASAAGWRGGHLHRACLPPIISQSQRGTFTTEKPLLAPPKFRRLLPATLLLAVWCWHWAPWTSENERASVRWSKRSRLAVTPNEFRAVECVSTVFVVNHRSRSGASQQHECISYDACCAR
ncbi:unnamed protein product, partial [Ectocarpus sp. 13 AM-2016]